MFGFSGAISSSRQSSEPGTEEDDPFRGPAPTNDERLDESLFSMHAYRVNSTPFCITIILVRSSRCSAQQNGKLGKLDKHFRVVSESVMSALKLCLLIQAVVVVSALAQTPAEQKSPLPSQAKQVHGLVVPVPKEIFRSLDQFRDASWSAVKRPEVARWKSHGDQAQIATLLGVVIAEGFIAMEAKDSTEVENLGKSVLSLARGLGIRDRAIRRSRSIMELADKNDWSEARTEWDGVLSDLETGMIEVKSGQLAQLVSLGGWLRGTEALSALVLQNYSPERASLIRQPELIDNLEKQLRSTSGDVQSRPIVVKLLDGIHTIRSLVESENGPPSEETVRKVHAVCAELVPLSSRRLD
jgi:hypothetical protein